MYVVTMQPPMLPPGEYTYRCDDDAHLRRVMAAFETLSVEVIDVERDGESMTVKELAEVLAG